MEKVPGFAGGHCAKEVPSKGIFGLGWIWIYWKSPEKAAAGWEGIIRT